MKKPWKLDNPFSLHHSRTGITCTCGQLSWSGIQMSHLNGIAGTYPTQTSSLTPQYDKGRCSNTGARYCWSAIIWLGIMIFGDFWWSWSDWNHHCRWSWFEWFFSSKMSLSISITLNRGSENAEGKCRRKNAEGKTQKEKRRGETSSSMHTHPPTLSL